MNYKMLIFAALLVSACGSDAEEVDPQADQVDDCNGGKCDIIGEDDRADEFDGEVTDRLREIARSTAAIIANESLEHDGDRVSIYAESLGASYMMCPDVRFQEQPAGAFCSAWLVAPDIMVTNGHCITSQQSCEASSFVFDYTLSEQDTDLSSVASGDVYACERVLAWDYTSDCDVDWAVVKLDRPVADREPLPVRSATDELDGDNLVIIGHPFGLPRKFSLVGDVLKEGDNVFTTTHDIFGGNSGSGIFDAETGEVQGLVTCGGSNLTWEWIDSGWDLDRKTGQPCDTSCDEAGEYGNGSWEECTQGTRRRCVCDSDGTQLVWEKRECLPFEVDSQGQCSREAQYSEFDCVSAPWLCPTPVMQHTRHFSHFVGDWTVASHSDPIEVPENEEVSSILELETEGQVQALSVSIDILGDQDPDSFDWSNAPFDLTVVLEHEGQSYELVANGLPNNGHAFDLTNAKSNTEAFQVPFMVDDAIGTDAAGEWTLRVSNLEYLPYTIHAWSLQARVVDESARVDAVKPCVADCEAGWEEAPEAFEETFEGEPLPIEDPRIEGTVVEGWSVEILDESGVGYEAIKTRRSQTISLERGEMALVKDFEENIGGRELTLDYRYDGDGWFQVWADDQILLSRQAFTQSVDSVSIPLSGARTIRVVLGATDDSQFHEVTLYSLELSSSLVSPASCSSILTCLQDCADEACQIECIQTGSETAQQDYSSLNQCLNDFCSDPALTDDQYSDCVLNNCADPYNRCLQ